MIVVRYAVCSEREQKPLTRAVVDSRAEAERQLERYRREDGHDVETAYWIAELGPECEAWRWLARKDGKSGKATKTAKASKIGKADMRKKVDTSNETNSSDEADSSHEVDTNDEADSSKEADTNDEADASDERGNEAAAQE